MRRLTTPEQREELKKSKKFKGKKVKDLSVEEKDELLEAVAKKLKIL